MRRFAPLCLAVLTLAACKKDAPTQSAAAEQPDWTAQIADIETIGGEAMQMKLPGTDTFAPIRGGQPIPIGSEIRTPDVVRATLYLGTNRVTLNHSTTLAFQADSIELKAGQAVIEHDGKADITVKLPTGEALLHKGTAPTKASVYAGEKESTITVTQGLVEVRDGNETFEGRAGEEVLLPASSSPEITLAADLAGRFHWSELSDPDAAIEQVPRGLGKLVGKTPGGETEHRLDLENHRVTVKVQGNIAYTEVTEIFQNPTGQTLEGVYRFPLPADAQISRLALRVGDKIMEGEFLETARAEQIWKDVIESWRDPAMLKWKEGNTFELRIFPIEPHQKREVTIGYVQRLEPTSRGYRYTYPMPVDHAALIPAKQFDFEATVFGHDPTMPLEAIGYAASVEHGATESDQPVSKVRFSRSNFVASGDLAIRFNRKDSGGLRSYGYVEPDGTGYAVFTLRPDLPSRPEIKPRDFVVILDDSYGRRGIAMDVQRRLTSKMIREMDSLDRVTVVACNHRCAPVGPAEFRPARASTADEFELAALDLEPRGATYPVEAMRVAADLFRRRSESNREAHIVYFTDGIVSAGELRPGPLGDAVRKTLDPFAVRATIVDVGGDRDDANLEALARGANGRIVDVDPNYSLTGQAIAILGEHYRTVLTEPTIVAPQGVTIDSILPVSVSSGDELVVAARFEGAPKGELELSGRIGAHPFVTKYRFELDRERRKGNAFVPREWASHRIRGLEMTGLDAGDPKKEIIALSKQFGVLSRYTTLLALESKEMMDEYGVKARKRTQFSGDEMAGEADAVGDTAEPMPVSKPAPRPRKKAKKRSAPTKSRPKDAAIDLLEDGDNFGGRRSSEASKSEPSSKRRIAPLPEPEGPSEAVIIEDDDVFSRPHNPPRPPRHSRRRRPPASQIHAARPTSQWENDNVFKKRQAHFDDQSNRSKRMALIRAQVRAGRTSAARQGAQDWLALNPMDPEALVQLAQIEAIQGNIDTFYTTLVSAADAAPRGKWLLERIQTAAEADGDDALACAYRISLEAVAKTPPKTPGDILSCPMATHVPAWFGGERPAPAPATTTEEKLRGHAVVTLDTSGQSDWDIVLIEPNGRLLWWGSARQNLKVSGVRGAARESVAIPSLRSGNYSVYVVPRTKNAGPTTVTVTVDVRGKSETFRETVTNVTEIAEFSR